MKKYIQTATITLLLIGLTSACYRRDIQVLVVDVPNMKTPACAAIISAAMQTTPPTEGLRRVETDVAARTVTFEYDSRKIAIKNLEYFITKAGFEANGNEPNLEAQKKLPPDCQ